MNKTLDLTKNIQGVLYGDNLNFPNGHWVLLRWFRIGVYSKFWDDRAKTAIGGPKWQYWDIPVKTSYDILNTNGRGPGPLGSSAKPNAVPGEIDNVQRLYILEKCKRPKEGDIIIEYENCPIYDNADLFIEYAKVNVGTPFKIQHVEHIRVDDNMQKYYLAWAFKDNRKP